MASAAAAAGHASKKQVVGIVFALLAGALGVGEIVASKVLVQDGWPFYYLGAINLGLFTILCAVARKARRERLPHLWELKWMFARSCFGCATLILTTVSVQVGADPGDAAALTSINVVAAALLGHAFLGERLRLVHTLALACSVVGGVLIARPTFLFGEVNGGDSDSGAAGNALLGNSLAVLAGLCMANIFVCARLAPDAPGLFCSGVTSVIASGLYCAVPWIIGRGHSMARVQAEPWSAVAMSLLLLAISSVRIVAGVAGAQLAPAAVGATSITVATTVTGYVLQFLFFQEPPAMLSLGGAALMVSAVVVMAVVRVKAADPVGLDARALQAGPPDAVDTASSSAGTTANAGTDTSSRAGEEDDDRDEVESIGSFVAFAASEFAEVGGHRKPIRNRRAGSAAAPGDVRAMGMTIGMAAAMSV